MASVAEDDEVAIEDIGRILMEPAASTIVAQFATGLSVSNKECVSTGYEILCVCELMKNR
ncbi:hypothetical protein [Aliiroseovarius subalbicans]|uniref:hypothetical protein n=1 Tax=Aliiroseovarius subalbicans TaxID=2925840 RepID=UPI001F5A0D7C|nr:hypothetical protein [Aliiroseovarius subalbicans]MCI2398963.1 hypothetical protein [Aliiroseovarius subalbicans]